jgi:hypothetical protein
MNSLINLINKLPLPKNVWVLVIAILVWWIVRFNIDVGEVVSFYTELQVNGVLPPEADSIGNPIMIYVFTEIFFCILLVVYALWTIKDFSSDTRVISFNKEKIVLGLIGWLITILWLLSVLSVFYVNLKEINLIDIGLKIVNIYIIISLNAIIQTKKHW